MTVSRKKNRLKFFALVNALVSVFIICQSCGKSEISARSNYLWQNFLERFNIKNEEVTNLIEIEKIKNSKNFKKIVDLGEKAALNDYHSTECGFIDGLVEHTDSLSAYTYSKTGARGNISLPGKTFILKFHDHEGHSSDERGKSGNSAHYALLAKPQLHDHPLPLVLWAHEATYPVNYSHIVGRLNFIQARSIVAMPIYPGECLIESGESNGVCSGVVENSEKYRDDVNSLLSTSGCMRMLNQKKTIPLYSKNFTLMDKESMNPFYQQIVTDQGSEIQQILMGYSYGGGVSLMAAAKAGLLIKLQKQGLLPQTEFHPHQFHAMGVISPFGSLLAGRGLRQVKKIFTEKEFQGGDNVEFHTFGFLLPILRNLINSPAPEVEDTVAFKIFSRESIFYSDYLQNSLRSWGEPENSHTCRLGYFFDESDKMVNAPISYRILMNGLDKTCPNPVFSKFEIQGAGHGVFTAGSLKNYFENDRERFEPKIAQKSLYYSIDFWFSSLF